MAAKPAPRATVTIGGAAVPAVRVSVVNDLRANHAIATATLDEDTGALDIPGGRQDVVIRLNDAADVLQDAFTGWTDRSAPRLTPWYENTLTAVGRKALLGAPLTTGAVYGGPSGWTFATLADALALKAGLTLGQYAITAPSGTAYVTLAAHREVLSRRPGALLAFWNRLMTAYDCYSADQRGGVVKVAPWPTAGAGSFAYTTADLLEGLEYPQDLGGGKNGVQVLGYVFGENAFWLDGTTPVPINRAAYALADAAATFPLRGVGSIDWDTLDEPLIELDAHATWLAGKRLARLNKVANTITASVAGVPTLDVGMIGTVDAAGAGLSSEGAVLVALQQDWDMDALTSTSRLTLEALTGTAGTAVGLQPVATLGVSGGGSTSVTVTVVPITSTVSDGPFRIRARNTGDAQEVQGSSDPAAADYAGVMTFGFAPEVAALSKNVIVDVEDQENSLRLVLTAAA